MPRQKLSDEEKKRRKIAYDKEWSQRNRPIVRACCKRWRHRNNERILISDRAKYAANKEKISAQRKASRAANPEKFKAQNDAWKKNNRERYLERRRIWNAAHSEQLRAEALKRYHRDIDKSREKGRLAARKRAIQNSEYQKRRLKANPEIGRNSANIRRARKAAATVGDPKAILAWDRKWKSKKRVRCYWCKTMSLTKGCQTDHIIPISKGGEHSISNLCASCRTCNAKKNARNIDDWNRELQQPVLF